MPVTCAPRGAHLAIDHFAKLVVAEVIATSLTLAHDVTLQQFVQAFNQFVFAAVTGAREHIVGKIAPDRRRQISVMFDQHPAGIQGARQVAELVAGREGNGRLA